MGLFLPALVVVVLDQITKHLFWKNAQNYEIIPGYFNITLVKNAGAAFGMFQGARVFFVTLLPKTRSGKVLRRSIQALAEGRDPGDLTTLDDPQGIEQIRSAVAALR